LRANLDAIVGGVGVGGVNGIEFLSGLALNVENCEIFGFVQNGINVDPSSGVSILDHAVVSNTRNGVKADGPNVGILIGNSVVTGNMLATSAVNGGSIHSYKTNEININVDDGPALGSVPLN
jgi:hypothetical protein